MTDLTPRQQQALERYQEKEKEKNRRIAEGLCMICGKRKGTITYSPDVMSYAHGFSELRCGMCYYGGAVIYNLQAFLRLPKTIALFLWSFVRRK